MTNPLLLIWRVCMGAGIGTIVGLFAGVSVFGVSTAGGSVPGTCAVLGTLAGGAITWLWERWKEREAIAASRPAPFIPLPPMDDAEVGGEPDTS